MIDIRDLGRLVDSSDDYLKIISLGKALISAGGLSSNDVWSVNSIIETAQLKLFEIELKDSTVERHVEIINNILLLNLDEYTDESYRLSLFHIMFRLNRYDECFAVANSIKSKVVRDDTVGYLCANIRLENDFFCESNFESDLSYYSFCFFRWSLNSHLSNYMLAISAIVDFINIYNSIYLYDEVCVLLRKANTSVAKEARSLLAMQISKGGGYFYDLYAIMGFDGDISESGIQRINDYVKFSGVLSLGNVIEPGFQRVIIRGLRLGSCKIICFYSDSVRKYFLGPLFLNGYTNEVLALSELWDSGFTPKVIDVIQVDGLYSMIQMQRISGDSCSKAILDPSCNKILLLNDIRILYDFLRHHSICHNDFTLENIICTPEGKVYLIDFENSSVGSSNCTDYLNLSLIYSDLN